VEGHIKEASYSADWGDVYSFVQHMKDKAYQDGRDLLLIDTGDLHDGTGLSDTTVPDGKITDKIFNYLDHDLLSIGYPALQPIANQRNHELYVGAITKAVYKNFVPRYNGERLSRTFLISGRYLTSNVNITVNGTSLPIGSRYRKFQTPANNYTILAFGVLFDFTGMRTLKRPLLTAGNDKFVSTCQPAHQLINEPWFQSVLRDETHDVDLIVVLGHTPLRNTTGFEYDLVLSAIRYHLPTIPVQFFGGHTHVRDFRKFDDFAHGIESGRYLETLGWINMNLRPFSIGRRYIDNNVDSYMFHVGRSTKRQFETEKGRAISEEIQMKA